MIPDPDRPTDALRPILSSDVTGEARRTLDMVYQNPTSKHLTWTQVVALVDALGDVEERNSDLYVFRVGASRLSLERPHTKTLTAPVILEFRRFLNEAGVSPKKETSGADKKGRLAPGLMIVIEGDGVKIYRIDGLATPGGDVGAYDPNHLLHHLKRKMAGEGPEGAKADEHRLFELIASAASAGGRILVVPDGKERLSEADRLKDYLRDNHPGAYARIVLERDGHEPGEAGSGSH